MFLARIVVCMLAFATIAGASARAEPPADASGSQQVIPRIASFSGLAMMMNLARGSVRMLAVISPGADSAAEDLAIVSQILDSNPSKRLRAFIVLTHESDADTQLRCAGLAARFHDRRAVFLWDPDHFAGARMAQLARGESESAHGLLFLYDTADTFTDDPATPSLWVDIDAPGRDGATRRLAARADELVREIERKASGAASQAR